MRSCLAQLAVLLLVSILQALPSIAQDSRSWLDEIPAEQLVGLVGPPTALAMMGFQNRGLAGIRRVLVSVAEGKYEGPGLLIQDPSKPSKPTVLTPARLLQLEAAAANSLRTGRVPIPTVLLGSASDLYSPRLELKVFTTQKTSSDRAAFFIAASLTRVPLDAESVLTRYAVWDAAYQGHGSAVDLEGAVREVSGWFLNDWMVVALVERSRQGPEISQP